MNAFKLQTPRDVYSSTVLPTQMRKSEKVAFRHLNFGVRQAERQYMYSVYGIEYSSKTCGLVGVGASIYDLDV